MDLDGGGADPTGNILERQELMGRGGRTTRIGAHPEGEKDTKMGSGWRCWDLVGLVVNPNSRAV